MRSRKKTLLISGSILFTIFVVGLVVYLGANPFWGKIVDLVNTDLSPQLFIFLMGVLPLFGFPISVFLVVAGIKFGIFAGILLWLLVLPIHAFFGYAAARYFRPFLKNILLHKLGYEIPTIPARHEAVFSLLFLSFPGIPYAAKNYLLALAGVSIGYSVVMNCLVQSLLGLPFIILGKSGADMDPTLFYIAMVAFGLIFLLIRFLKKKYSDR